MAGMNSHATPRLVPPWPRPATDSLLADVLRAGKPAWTETINLLWTVWVFIVPMFTPSGYDLRWVALTAVSYPSFVALYVGAYRLPRRWIGACSLGMIVLCLALLHWYPSGLSYFVFGCVLLGARGGHSLWGYLAQLLVLNVLLIVLAKWIGYPWSALAWMPVTTLVIGVLIHMERSNERRDAELRLSHEEVRRLASTAERERIGRDLHDLLGHTLSLIALKLELSRKLFERDAAGSQRELAEAEQIARDALAQVRSAVTGFRAADLAAELASARLLLESSCVNLRYSPPPPMPGWIECGLAMVLREAVTNIARHARANEATISLSVEAGTVVLEIADDGRGGVSADGNGLAGMRERVVALEGTLDIDSPRNGGTRLMVRVPIGPATASLAGEADPDAAATAEGHRLPAPEARA